MTKTINRALVCVALLVWAWGCTRQSIDQPEAKTSEPVSSETAHLVRREGQKIVAETFSLLSSNLQSAMASGGPSAALPFCSVAAIPLTASAGEKHGVTVRRFSHRPRNPANAASGDEQSIIESFQAGIEARNQAPAIVKRSSAGKFTFYAPIILNNDLCLNCHGDPAINITPETLALIRKHYPQDQAVNFKKGDLRGGWRVDFDEAQLAKFALQAKTLEGKE